MKRIFIDTTSIVTTPTGVGKYSYHLLNAMLKNKNFKYHFTILYQSNLLQSYPLHFVDSKNVRLLPIKIPVVGPKRDIGLFRIRKLINQHALLHCLHTYLPAFGVKIPATVTIHDLKYLIFPNFFNNRLKSVYYNWIICRTVQKARQVIAISSATKKDIVNLVGISADKVTVIHEAATISPANVKKDFKLPDVVGDKPFFFFVGKNKPHKNIARIIEAHRRLMNTLGEDCPPFVFAGSDFDILRQKHAGKEESRKLIFLGPVSDETLICLYKHAIAFVYPSLYEGFGLPILEAMAMGTPVITSNCSSIPEVAGQAAILIDPYNVGQLAEAMVRIVQSKNERERLKQLGFRRAKVFSWEKAARMTLELYEDILSNINN